jgi:hypothetical protein
MRRLVTTTILLFLMLFGVGSTGRAQVSFGIRIGPPPAARVVRVQPPRPGPSYVWVEGYWYPTGNHYVWHNGYWTRAPYGGGYWVQPRHDGQRYYPGYWEGDRGRIEHNHRWDRARERDYGHGR